MSNQEWGVTERGFHRPTYVELLDAIEYKARALAISQDPYIPRFWTPSSTRRGSCSGARPT